MIRGLVSSIVLTCLLAAPVQAQDEAGEADMFQRVNALRRAAGLQPFERHPRLDAAARTHSGDMAWHDELSHESERTGDPATRVAAAGLRAEAVGENIARNRNTLAAHQALVASEPHLANLVSAEYTHIGLASHSSEAGEVWVTQVFARLSSETVSPETDPPEEAAAPDEPAAPAAPRAPEEPPAPTTPTPSVGTPYAGGAVVGVSQGGGRQVIGYWVHSRGRWWYYRLPPNARHGQELQADPNVTGPPPGYDAAGYPSGAAYGHQGQVVRPPPFGWSPRRHYYQWQMNR